MSRTQNNWRDRPPAVVVCPRCNGGIYQHRHQHAIDCNDCEYRDLDPYITEYEVVRFDCPDCGADIEEYGTRNLAGGDAPEFVTHINCSECGMSWEAPHH